MFGYVSSLAFYHVPDKHGITGLNWRLMLGSAGFPAIFVMAQVYLLPESPRWLMKRGRYVEAFNSLKRVRNSPLQAARDLYCEYSCFLLVLFFLFCWVGGMIRWADGSAASWIQISMSC